MRKNSTFLSILSLTVLMCCGCSNKNFVDIDKKIFYLSFYNLDNGSQPRSFHDLFRVKAFLYDAYDIENVVEYYPQRLKSQNNELLDYFFFEIDSRHTLFDLEISSSETNEICMHNNIPYLAKPDNFRCYTYFYYEYTYELPLQPNYWGKNFLTIEEIDSAILSRYDKSSMSYLNGKNLYINLINSFSDVINKNSNYICKYGAFQGCSLKETISILKTDYEE